MFPPDLRRIFEGAKFDRLGIYDCVCHWRRIFENRGVFLMILAEKECVFMTVHAIREACETQWYAFWKNWPA